MTTKVGRYNDLGVWRSMTTEVERYSDLGLGRYNDHGGGAVQ